MPMPASYWEREVRLRPSRPVPRRTDVVVIGGGFAGLATAIRIRERGVGVTVLEAERIGFGASGRNAGFLSPLAAPIWLVGREHAWAAAQINREVHELARWIGGLSACELAPATLAMRGTSRLWDGSVRALADAVARVGLAHSMTESIVERGRAVLAMDAYTMHPFALVRALADRAEQLGVDIHEGARATAIEGTRVRISGESAIEAGTIVVCTNGYTGPLDVGERLRALTVHSLLAASAPLALDAGANASRDGDMTIEVSGLYQPYHRTHDRRVIFGGVDVLRAPRDTDRARRQLSEAMAISVPGATIAQVWGGAFHATTTGLPILRRSTRNPAVVLNVGYGGTGVALSLVCAKLAAALATGSLAGDDERLYAALRDTRVSMRDSLKTFMGIASRFARPWR